MQVQTTLFDQLPERRYYRRRYRRSDQPWKTAVHESGHAVIGQLLGIPFTQVTIRPSLGLTLRHVSCEIGKYLRGDPDGTSCRIAAAATFLVAGYAAVECIALLPVEIVRAPGSDYELLDKLLGGEHAPEGEKQSSIQAFEAQARRILSIPNVPAMVIRLASALTMRTTLTHGQAVRAMEGDFGWML